MLNAVYETDFLGFSYGFRPGRPHDALHALAAGIYKKVNWVLDADIRDFFANLDRGWLEKFLEHRIADQRVLRLIGKWLGAGSIEDGEWSESVQGAPQGASFRRCSPTSTCTTDTSSTCGHTGGVRRRPAVTWSPCGTPTTLSWASSTNRTHGGFGTICANGSQSLAWNWPRRRRA